MSVFRNDMTLKEARDLLRTMVEEGATCPCCTQFAKVYKRKMTSASVRAIMALYWAAGREWGHLPTIVRERVPDISHQGGYMNLSVHWGLMEEERTLRPDGGRAGFWRVTDLGEAWLRDQTTVPKYALIYDSRCLGRRGVPVGVRDALGSKFSYDDLMAGV
jgi:hypothetical protein